jgi:hypothetical protein
MCSQPFQDAAVSSASRSSSAGRRARGVPPMDSSTTPPLWPSRRQTVVRSPSPLRSSCAFARRPTVRGVAADLLVNGLDHAAELVG